MTIPLTDQQLDAIETRANNATPGPWCTDSWEIYQGTEYEPGISQWIGETCRGTSTLEQDRADAEFVAHARTDVPQLIAEIRRLHAVMEQIRHLHKDSPMGACPVCVDADALGRGEDYTVPYPCPTARLAGAQDIDPPHVRAAQYAAAGDEMAASLVRDGFGDDEIADMLRRTPGDAQQPAEACAKCRQPFDPTDTRFDGRGRHGETPFCRRCIDLCHESSDAFHQCAVCQ